jgi:hypothetical protein
MGPECAICSFIATPPSGGWYTENEFSRVGPFLAPTSPGAVLVYLRRHAAGLSDMRPEELQSLVPTLAAGARAIERALQPERVYTVLFGEQIQMRVPRFIGRLFAGEAGVVMMTEARGASNAKAKRELAWRPAHPSWREGFAT